MSIPGMSPDIVAVGDGVLPDMSIPGMSAAIVGDGVLPDMSIPGMSAAIVGDGVLPDMSIPGMSAAMVGDGVLPDMSIPGMSAAMVGDGVLPDPTSTGTAVALTRVAAEDSWREVSINPPATAITATAAPTDATWIHRPHRRRCCSTWAGRTCLRYFRRPCAASCPLLPVVI